MANGVENHLLAGVVHNPFIVQVQKGGIGLVDHMVNSTDRLDKLIKFAETFFRACQELIASSPITVATLHVIKQTSKWLTALTILADVSKFTELAKDTALDIGKKCLIYGSHLFTALNFFKECGSSLLSFLDVQLGRIAILGTQLSFRFCKDFSLIIASAISLGQTLHSIFFDKEGNPRNLLELIFAGKFDQFLKYETLLNLLNNISKIYLISSVLLGAPYDFCLFIMGFILGSTTLMQYTSKYADTVDKKLATYQHRAELFARLPRATPAA